MSSLHALCHLPSVKKQKHDFHFFSFNVMYNKTIGIRFGFRDIKNNQGLSKGYQPKLKAEAMLKA